MLNTIQTVIRGIVINQREVFNAYLFGSVLYKSSPNDIDILVVYDLYKLDPQQAHVYIKPFIDKIEGALNIQVHLSLLTINEESSVNFINRLKCKNVLETG